MSGRPLSRTLPCLLAGLLSLAPLLVLAAAGGPEPALQGGEGRLESMGGLFVVQDRYRRSLFEFEFLYSKPYYLKAHYLKLDLFFYVLDEGCFLYDARNDTAVVVMRFGPFTMLLLRTASYLLESRAGARMLGDVSCEEGVWEGRRGRWYSFAVAGTMWSYVLAGASRVRFFTTKEGVLPLYTEVVDADGAPLVSVRAVKLLVNVKVPRSEFVPPLERCRRVIDATRFTASLFGEYVRRLGAGALRIPGLKWFLGGGR